MYKQPLYNVKQITSGKRVEVYLYNNVKLKEYTVKKSQILYSSSDEDREKRKVKTLQAARNQIIRLISSNQDLTTFITLTYRENYQFVGISKEHLNKFFKQLRKDYMLLKYCYVIEFQERGAIHYHILTNWPVPVATALPKHKKPEDQKKYEQFFSSTYWNWGFVDIRNLYTDCIDNVAKYVSCYLTKDTRTLGLEYNHCYGFSRNLRRPKEEKLFIDKPIPDLLKDYGSKYDLQYCNSYMFGEMNTTYFDMIEREG